LIIVEGAGVVVPCAVAAAVPSLCTTTEPQATSPSIATVALSDSAADGKHDHRP